MRPAEAGAQTSLSNWAISRIAGIENRRQNAPMTHYRLHYFPESGNSFKLALMLNMCGETFERVWTDFGGGVTRTPEWRERYNAMGEIPVLEIDGEPRTQTAPILIDLAQRFERFGGETAAERSEVLRWLFWDNHKLSGYAATYRFFRTFTPSPDPSVQTFLLRRIRDFLRVLEVHLARKPFVAGANPTIADISMIAYLSYPSDETGFDFGASNPAVQNWLDRVAALPGWKPPYELLPGQRLTRYI